MSDASSLTAAALTLRPRKRTVITGIMIPNIEAAGALAMPFLLIQILFSGFYLSKGAIPVWFIWAYYLSFFHYSLLVLIKNLFEGFYFAECTPSWTRFCPFGPGRASADRLLLQYGAGPGTMTKGELFAVTLGYAAAFAFIGARPAELPLLSVVDTPAHRQAACCVPFVGCLPILLQQRLLARLGSLRS